MLRLQQLLIPLTFLFHSVSASDCRSPSECFGEIALILIIFVVVVFCMKFCDCCREEQKEQSTSGTVLTQSYQGSNERPADYPRQSLPTSMQPRLLQPQHRSPQQTRRYVPLHPTQPDEPTQQLQQPVQPPYPLEQHPLLPQNGPGVIGWGMGLGSLEELPTAPPLQRDIPLTPPPRYEDICGRGSSTTE